MCGGIDIFGAGDRKFDCEVIGRVTIRELYAQGWRVVAGGFLPERATPLRSHMYLIIERQRQ